MYNFYTKMRMCVRLQAARTRTHIHQSAPVAKEYRIDLPTPKFLVGVLTDMNIRSAFWIFFSMSVLKKRFRPLHSLTISTNPGSYIGSCSEFQASILSFDISTTCTEISGHFQAITLQVGPPTYPAPIQQIVRRAVIACAVCKFSCPRTGHSTCGTEHAQLGFIALVIKWSLLEVFAMLLLKLKLNLIAWIIPTPMHRDY